MKKCIFAEEAVSILSEQSKFEVQSHKIIRIKTNGGIIRVLLSDILYIKSDLYMLDLYLLNGVVLSHIGVLNTFMAKLKDLYFIQLSRSLIVNGLQIQEIIKKPNEKRRSIIMNNGEMFFIPRRRWNKINDILDEIA